MSKKRGCFMFINKTDDGFNNICGKKIAYFRTALNISQRQLADKMQLVGINIDKNAIQRIECGKRFVTNIEIIAFVKVFNITYEELLNTQKLKMINFLIRQKSSPVAVKVQVRIFYLLYIETQ